MVDLGGAVPDGRLAYRPVIEQVGLPVPDPRVAAIAWRFGTHQRPHLGSALEQRIHEMPADEPRGTGDDDDHARNVASVQRFA